MAEYKDTPPEDFAWASIDRALEFAHALTSVMISNEVKHENFHSDIERVVNQRIGSVLQVLHEFSPVKLATLWKLKARAQHGSLIAATRQHQQDLNPNDADERREYVCGFNESHLKVILEKYAAKITSNGPSVRRGIVFFENIGDLKHPDWFLPKEQLESRGLKKMVAIPFWRSGGCVPPNGDLPNYFLNLYYSEYNAPSTNPIIPSEFFNAIQSKLTSGIRALIDHRLVGITRAISNVTVSDGGVDAGSAMDNALMRVLPKYIMCERIIRLEQAGNGSVRISTNLAIDSQNQAKLQPRLNRTTEQLLVELIEEVLEPADGGHPGGPSSFGEVKVASQSAIESHLAETELSDVSSLIVGTIQNRGQPDLPRGYVILANRLNDLATMRRPDSRIKDYFDWEDEVYLDHVCSVLDFIAELFTAEEARMNRVHVLAHEMQAPTGFIYSTAERIHESLTGGRPLPEPQKRRELRDILDANDLQTALIDSLMFGLRTGRQSPARFYRPQKTDLNRTAEAVARMVKPLCRRHNVDSAGIKMRVFPELFIDNRAATQLFLNVLTNAIKYHDPHRDFRFTAFSERIDIGEIRPTNAPLGPVYKVAVRRHLRMAAMCSASRNDLASLS